MSNLGCGHSSQEDPAQHEQWGQRGHSSLAAADVVHQGVYFIDRLVLCYLEEERPWW